MAGDEVSRRVVGAATGVILGYVFAHVTVFYLLGGLLLTSVGVHSLDSIDPPLVPLQLLVSLLLAGLMVVTFKIDLMTTGKRSIRWMLVGALLFLSALVAHNVRSPHSVSADEPAGSGSTETISNTQNIFERLELVQYKTGFYRSIDINSQQLLFVPLVILKFKNVSSSEISGSMEIKAIFVAAGEEWGVSTAEFRSDAGSPLQPGLARQVNLQSPIGWKSELGVFSKGNPEIECRIVVDGKPFKTLKVERTVLYSNLIQSTDEKQ